MCWLWGALLHGLRSCLPRGEEEVVLTLGNSGLTEEQIGMAECCLEWLGLAGRRDDLARQDLLALCFAVGMNPSEDVVESKLRMMGLGGRTFVDFAHLWFQLMLDTEDEERVLRRAFCFFDKDGNGEVTGADLKAAMGELGGMLTDQDVDTFLQLLNKGGATDGVLVYEEFVRVLRSHRPLYLCALPGHGGESAGLEGGGPSLASGAYCEFVPVGSIDYRLPGTPDLPAEEEDGAGPSGKLDGLVPEMSPAIDWAETAGEEEGGGDVWERGLGGTQAHRSEAFRGDVGMEQPSILKARSHGDPLGRLQPLAREGRAVRRQRGLGGWP